MNGITILLVDDHPVVRAGYRKLLERQGHYTITAEAENAAEAYRLYRKVTPDIVVMDLSLPGASGIEAIRLIRGFDRNARILVFTMHQSTAFASKAFEAGASGYVTKSSEPEELIAAVAAVARGERALSDDIARELGAERLSGRRSPVEDLGPRELEILRLIASGRTSEAISQSLSLSLKTVQNYHSAIKSKLSVHTDADLVWIAVAAGLLQRQPFE
ncbi:response regulator transcription factor [Methylobacterium organophilum]|uniref:response regulator n=1 Tax=Methylobacterium organophilum TaxID=410 RepID=UPI001F132AD0|nr:response regulator transcription factor [Methylobacterium organophilum]UMY19923.1 response regulator transcription factor [Methylobacterium organophilum]